MQKTTFKKQLILFGCLCFFNTSFDVANNVIGGIQKVVMTASKAVREEILPWKERISKVQDFFKKASFLLGPLTKSTNQKMYFRNGNTNGF